MADFTSNDVQAVLDQTEVFLSNLLATWDAQNVTGAAWWVIHRQRLVQSVLFIIDSLDVSIQFVEDLVPNGTDKKILVLMIVSKIFDYTALQAFPFWLKPFISTIKSIFIDILLANLVDFFVQKYNDNLWAKEADVTQG